MKVAVACNLSDGVVLGVDSAVTIPTSTGILKVHENAEKLFQLEERPIGVAAYGLGALGVRGIGSHPREFELSDPKKVVSSGSTLTDLVEAIREFFMSAYLRAIVPALEQATGKRFADIPPEEIPVLGLVVGGFSHGAYLSEVWDPPAGALDTWVGDVLAESGRLWQQLVCDV